MRFKTAFLPVIGLLAMLATACGGEGDTIVQAGAAPVSGIAATGTGEAVGAPDVMVLTLGVTARRPSVGEARDAAAAAQNAVIDALKKNGVAEKDIQTLQFSVNPEYDFRSGSGQRQITGYVVSNVVRAKVRDLAKAGAAIDAATAAGGNDAVVQGLYFGIDDPTELQKKAREQAVKKAKDQAEQLASNAGVRLGKLLSISEGGGAVPLQAEDARAALAVDTPIEQGELTVRVSVTLLYAVD